MKKKSFKQNRQRLKVIPGEGRRFSLTNLKQGLVFYVFLLLALVVIVQLGYHWMGGQFLAWRLQVVEAETGIMQQELTVVGIVTRQEEVIRAPASGMILNMADAGERASVGAEMATLGILSRNNMESLRGSNQHKPDEDLWDQLLNYWRDIFPAENTVEDKQNEETIQDEEINQDEETNRMEEIETDQPEQSDTGINEPVIVQDETIFEELLVIYNENPGFVSHFIDGWENHSGPIYIPQKDLEENIREGLFVFEGDLVETGEPILKIVDNWQWFFSIVVPLHPGSTLAGLQIIEIEFAFAPGEVVKARRHKYEIDDADREVRIFYIIEKQLPGFDQARQTAASLIYRRQQGIIIPAEAVFEKDSGKGVFLNQGGRVVFQPITVIEKQEEKVMVDGLAPFSLVITRPGLVEEGQRLN